MADLTRNNLDRATSPYLRQHAANPVWWQEWNAAVLQEAAKQGKPLFVSVGYATCHWCHVMAAEAFSHPATADLLNKYFISIKVDREQRPDIDQYLMRFLLAQSGSGGWPLNAFLAPDLAPIFACTYAPAEGRGRGHTLSEIAQLVHEHFRQHADAIPTFVADEPTPAVVEEDAIVANLAALFDPAAGGFGSGQKFPPHSTLLYLLYYLSAKDDAGARRICQATLDAMALRGLHDHLQGGVFRYCVDRAWTIPHFEKMLYDQAMALWCYALAAKVFKSDAYRAMAGGIVRCLVETFETDGLFISAHDADTDHEEGGTYVWRYDELADELTPGELATFGAVYDDIRPEGNFEGAIHLVRKSAAACKEIEAKLLAIRRKRKQPHRDDKILCGINALAAAALIQAARCMEVEELETKGTAVVRRLLATFWDGRTLAHSLYDGMLQKQSYLFDAAALLFAVSLLYENDAAWREPMTALAKYLETFREEDRWIESRADDFRPVYASWFDHPIPSSAALAEMGLARVAILTGQTVLPLPHRRPFEADFHNVAALLCNGLFHLLTAKQALPWREWPANTIQTRGDVESDCYMGTCRPLEH